MDEPFEIDVDYLAFGTKQVDHPLGRRKLSGPWKVYAVSRDMPSVFYRVLRANENYADHFPLSPDMDEYGKIYKWVINRDILSQPKSKCHVDWESVVVLLDGVPPRNLMH